MTKYDVRKFFKFVGIPDGEWTYHNPDLNSLNVFCRGDADQIKQLLSLTPFDYRDDWFIISVADFANASPKKYMDAAIILPVMFEGKPAVSYYFEYEDEHWSVATGRELWGYPKRFAKISLEKDERGARARVWDYDTEVFSVELTFDKDMTRDTWSEFRTIPHLQIRAIPQIDGPSFDKFDVLSRESGKDFALKERHVGRAKVNVGKLDLGNDVLEGKPFVIKEVLGGEYFIGDFASLKGNGTAKIIASFV